MKGPKKDLIPLIRHAKKHGWMVEYTGSQHLRWQSPTGAFVFSGNTVSDHRAVHNIRARLRRAGLDV